MRIDIICVGKLKETWWRDAADEYLKRLSRYGKVEVLEVPDLPAGEKLSPVQEEQVKEAEGERILARLRPGVWPIALDGRGKMLDSVEFSKYLTDHEIQSHEIAFIIGGSLGLSPAVLKACKGSLSFGKMTWPHQIARILLLEQIYRGCRIAHNEPYHK